MPFEIEFKPKALKDLEALPQREAHRIVLKIENLRGGLQGDVKRLTEFTPEYRLRAGNYRILFELEDEKVIVYRVLHRKDADDEHTKITS
jgi:mRNA interferase RelE/StbE